MSKALQAGGDLTLDQLMNSIARKVLRGDLNVGEIVYLNRTGEGILKNGKHGVALIRGAFKVEIMRDIESVEVKPVR